MLHSWGRLLGVVIGSTWLSLLCEGAFVTSDVCQRSTCVINRFFLIPPLHERPRFLHAPETRISPHDGVGQENRPPIRCSHLTIFHNSSMGCMLVREHSSLSACRADHDMVRLTSPSSSRGSFSPDTASLDDLPPSPN